MVYKETSMWRRTAILKCCQRACPSVDCSTFPEVSALIRPRNLLAMLGTYVSSPPPSPHRDDVRKYVERQIKPNASIQKS